MSHDPLQSPAALEEFIQSFRDGTFPAERWHHREHVIMAAWHLLKHSVDEATPLIRERIKRYNEASGGQNTAASGYHETLTIFWIRILAHRLGELDGLGPFEKIQALANEFGNRGGLFREYYSFDVAKSTEARVDWIEPDLAALPLPGKSR
jgi:hypothetical protein